MGDSGDQVAMRSSTTRAAWPLLRLSPSTHTLRRQNTGSYWRALARRPQPGSYWRRKSTENTGEELPRAVAMDWLEQSMASCTSSHSASLSDSKLPSKLPSRSMSRAPSLVASPVATPPTMSRAGSPTSLGDEKERACVIKATASSGRLPQHELHARAAVDTEAIELGHALVARAIEDALALMQASREPATPPLTALEPATPPKLTPLIGTAHLLRTSTRSFEVSTTPSTAKTLTQKMGVPIPVGGLAPVNLAERLSRARLATCVLDAELTGATLTTGHQADLLRSATNDFTITGDFTIAKHGMATDHGNPDTPGRSKYIQPPTANEEERYSPRSVLSGGEPQLQMVVTPHRHAASPLRLLLLLLLLASSGLLAATIFVTSSDPMPMEATALIATSRGKSHVGRRLLLGATRTVQFAVELQFANAILRPVLAPIIGPFVNSHAAALARLPLIRDLIRFLVAPRGATTVRTAIKPAPAASKLALRTLTMSAPACLARAAHKATHKAARPVVPGSAPAPLPKLLHDAARMDKWGGVVGAVLGAAAALVA